MKRRMHGDFLRLDGHNPSPKMIGRAESLLKKVSNRIAVCSAKGDFGAVSNLAEVALTIQGKLEEARSLAESLEFIERQVEKFGSTASGHETILAGDGALTKSPSPPPVKRSYETPITVSVRWNKVSMSAEPELIACSTAAATLLSFLEKALTTTGEEYFGRLISVRTGRGPLVSKNPSLDYVNKSTGSIYTHHRVGNSAWYAITHSSTQEKVEHLKEALRVLSLTGSTISIGDKIVAASVVVEPEDSDGGRI